jgi:hypothetical protein
MKNAASCTSLLTRFQRDLRVGLCAAAFALAAGHLHAQAPATQTTKPGVSMQKFAFIFRQTNFPMTPEQQKKRAEEVRGWAIHQRDEGHSLDPHLLGAERYLATPDGTKPSSADSAPADPVVAILILDASNFEEAKRIAATHPGLRYGVSIEVREATAPVAPPVPTAAAR